MIGVNTSFDLKKFDKLSLDILFYLTEPEVVSFFLFPVNRHLIVPLNNFSLQTQFNQPEVLVTPHLNLEV